VTDLLATPRAVAGPVEQITRGEEATTSRGRRPRRVHALTIAVLLISLTLILTASILANSVHRHTEQRLLDRQALQAAATLEAASGSINSILAPAAELAASTAGDGNTFEASLGESVGENKRYISASLWQRGTEKPLVVLGAAPAIQTDAARTSQLLADALGEDTIAVAGLVGEEPTPRYGYAFASRSPSNSASPAFVVYVESPLPVPRRGFQNPEGAFSNLEYALYHGTNETDVQLLYSSAERLPISGRRAETTVPFGNADLLLVVAPIEPLSGGLSRTLPWIVALVGAALSLGFAGLTERLLRRRDDAVATSGSLELLSHENARLYNEQRGIAETLQRSLLPDHLPELPRARVTARYWPAGTASEVGGDFYDLFELGDRRWGLTIGDVCGKGVSAAALTGVARHTIQAAARHVDSPSEVLRWVHEAMKSKETTMFCTVCFGVMAVADSGPVRLDLALGGHPPPLLCRSDGSSEEIGVVGTVLGIIEPSLTDVSYELRGGDMVVLFTDGLTDAPHDTAVTIAEVQAAHAARPGRTPEELAEHIQTLIEARRPLGSGDDTALLILRVDDAGH
jgi:serine phosphatase RsbU (regulator of sigma subunit)